MNELQVLSLTIKVKFKAGSEKTCSQVSDLCNHQDLMTHKESTDQNQHMHLNIKFQGYNKYVSLHVSVNYNIFLPIKLSSLIKKRI